MPEGLQLLFRRVFLSRILALALISLAAPGIAAGAEEKKPAEAEGPMIGPYVVADAETGAVYQHHDALRPWFPASTTKLMTAYVVFKAIRNGDFTMESPVTVSEHASAEPASKMGFEPGTTLTIDSALKMVLVHSANDMAMALAETVGGSEAGFSALMNMEAKRLGMTRSHFVNPNGLPDPRQLTTARDMAILTRALLVDFPEHRSYFSIPAIKFGGRVLKNHNSLLDRYPGATGMKTGYICSSGFNVVATAKRDGRELVAVVFGSYNSGERSEFTARLFEKTFTSLDRPRQPRVHLANVSSGATYGEAFDMRPIMCSGKKKPSLADDLPSALGPKFFIGPPADVAILSVPVDVADLPRLPRARPVLPTDAAVQENAFAPTTTSPDPSAAVIGPEKPLPRPEPQTN